MAPLKGCPAHNALSLTQHDSMIADRIIISFAPDTPREMAELLQEWLNRKVDGRPFLYQYDPPSVNGDWCFTVTFPPKS